MDARSENAESVAHNVPKRRRELPDKQVPGLRLRIGTRSRVWVLIARLPGQHPTRHKIGDAALMTRAEARAEALRWKAALAAGKDPAVRHGQRTPCFGDVAERFFADCRRRGLRRAHEVERDTRRIFKAWWHRPIAAIDRGDVLHLIGQHQSYAAHHAFSYASRLFGWALERGIVDRSPCHGLRPSRLIGPKPPRERVLTDAELRSVWTMAGQLECRAGTFIRILILTGQRRGEVAGMRWSEISTGTNGTVWTIPASRTKSKRQHGVPLVPEVMALLAGLPRVNDFVFGRPIGGFDHIRKKLPAGEYNLHDLRRTARSGMAACGVMDEVAERVLNHAPTRLVATYNRHRYEAEMRAALQAWSDRVHEVVIVKVICEQTTLKKSPG
jgi:integrase